MIVRHMHQHYTLRLHSFFQILFYSPVLLWEVINRQPLLCIVVFAMMRLFFLSSHAMITELRILTVLLIFGFSAAAQQIEPKHTFNVEIGLPNGMVNKPFGDYMQGLVNVAPYYQFCLKNHIAFGAGVRYAYFGVNQFRVPLKTLGGMHSFGAFLKVSHEKFYSEKFAADLGVKVGYTQNYFVTNRNDSLGQNPYQVNAFLVEPTAELSLLADEQVAYSLIISYAFQGFGFKPSMIGLETSGGYEPAEFSRPTSYLTVGFGFTYYFKEKK